MSKKNEYLIQVFEDTLTQIPKVFNHTRDVSSSKLNIDDFSLGDLKPTKVEVVKSDSISTVIKTHSENPDAKICVLNMASRKRPGGGVKNGAKAQEEDLFRCSTLSLDISTSFYPLKENEFVYTENAQIFKDSNYQNIDPIAVDVVSMPSINLNAGKYNETTQQYEDVIIEKPQGYTLVMMKKIHAILNSAKHHNCDVIILGAWGCGVFKNNPEDVALMFKNALKIGGYAHHFKRIIFPIFNDKNSNGDNYNTFKKVFSS